MTDNPNVELSYNALADELELHPTKEDCLRRLVTFDTGSDISREHFATYGRYLTITESIDISLMQGDVIELPLLSEDELADIAAESGEDVLDFDVDALNDATDGVDHTDTDAFWASLSS